MLLLMLLEKMPKDIIVITMTFAVTFIMIFI